MARKLLLALWVLLMVAVVVGSLLPESVSPMAALDRLGASDFVLHSVAYMALAFLPALLIRPRRRGQYAAAAMFVLGLALEIAQGAAPGREFELVDLAANALGVAAGIVGARFVD